MPNHELTVGGFDDGGTVRGFQLPYNILDTTQGDTFKWKKLPGSLSYEVLFKPNDWPFTGSHHVIKPNASGETRDFTISNTATGTKPYQVKIKLEEQFATIEPVIIIDPQNIGIPIIPFNKIIIGIVSAIVGFAIGYAAGASMG